MQIRLTTLGAVRIHLGGCELPDLPAQRLRFALLLYLAVERDVSREDVLAMFWPDSDTGRGKHALRQMLYELRQVLGEDWIDVRRDRIVVQAGIDAAEFEKRVEAGDRQGALEIYDGAFIHGFALDNRTFEGWAERRRAHLARLHRRIAREHIAGLVETGRTEEALAAARRWVELDPLEDEAAHTLIERLISAGQRNAALQYYDNYERQLRAELDVEPLEATTSLIAAVRAGDVPPVETLSLRPATAGMTAAPVAAPKDRVEPAQRPARSWRTSWWLPVAATVVVLITSVLVFAAVDARGTGSGATLPSNRDVRVAVVPFTANSTDAAHAVFTTMVTETLARRLADVPFLDVMTPNTVALKHAAGTVADDSGRMFGADYIVGGTVARDGVSVVLTIDLIDARTETVVNNERFERDWVDNYELLEEVVQVAARFLRAELGREVDIARTRSNTDTEAWQLVLQAKAVQPDTRTLFVAGELDEVHRRLDTADSLLILAASIDRAWAEPLVQRGRIAERRGLIASIEYRDEPARRRAFIRDGIALADSALLRDAGHAAAHALRGMLIQQLARELTTAAEVRPLLGRAESALAQAVGIDPRDQQSWRRLADLYFATGRYGQAELAAQNAYRLDPDGPVSGIINVLFGAAFENGEDRKAEGWCLDGRRRFPDELPFLYCLLALHAWGDVPPEPERIDDAMREFQQSDRRLQPALEHRFETMRAAVYARAGRTETARRILAAVPRDSDDIGLLWMRASAHAALDQDSIAHALLSEYLEKGGWEAPRVAASRPFWRLNGGAPPLQRRISRADRAP